jgi:catechol 2,3-dioxygenase-like lactoylglutathione lyase family enzyme
MKLLILNNMGIRHIEFWVSDLKNSLEFYKELFSHIDWKQVDENGFSCNGTKIYFCEMKDLIKDNKVVGPRHICFEVKSKEAVDIVSKLPIIKNRILHGPDVLHKNGSYMLVFKDPDGYILEVAYKK